MSKEDYVPMTLEQHVEALEQQFAVDSSGTAQSVHFLTKFYRDNVDRDPNRVADEDLYTIEDHWTRCNAETERVIAEGTKYVAGLFTIREVEDYIRENGADEPMPKFNQVRSHLFEFKKVDNNPLR